MVTIALNAQQHGNTQIDGPTDRSPDNVRSLMAGRDKRPKNIEIGFLLQRSE